MVSFRAALRPVAAVCLLCLVFASTALLLARWLPGRPRATDYLVVGTLATIATLAALFLLLLATSLRGSDVFYKRRGD